MYNPYKKTTKDWFRDKDRPTKLTKKNLDYIREWNVCSKELAKVAILGYILLTEFGIENARPIFQSAAKQRDLCYKARKELKEYGLTSEWYATMDSDLEAIHTRAVYAFTILKENLRLTGYYPYFQNTGFDQLIDITGSYTADKEGTVAALKEEIEKWNADHPEEVARHMEAIAQEKENYERHKAKMAEDAKAEKQAKRLAKKMANAEVKEIRENAKRYAKRQKEVERSFAQYYK